MAVWDQLVQPVRRLRHPRTTVRRRLALLYGSLFLASGVILLTVTYFLVEWTFPVSAQLPAGSGSGRAVGGIPVAPGGTSSVPISPSAATALYSQVRSTDLHHLLVASSVTLALMVAGSIALGWLVAGRVLRPLRTITAATRQISEHNLHQRLALEGPCDELKDLSDTIDGLLGRLQDAFDAQRQFVANASHELRTPLTVGRTLLEMILGDPDATVESYRATCQDILESEIQQEQLIEALLTLARSQRGLDRRESLDLAVIVADVTQARQPTAIARQLHLDLTARPASLSGDPHLVERLVSNLVDNALHYNHPSGKVHAEVGTHAGQATLTVTNTGPHVPADQLDRLLQPFQRITTDRAGHNHDGLGLGLSIVHAVVNAHGASLTLQPGDTGGLRVEVRFQPPPAGYPAPASLNGSSSRSEPRRQDLIRSRSSGRSE